MSFNTVKSHHLFKDLKYNQEPDSEENKKKEKQKQKNRPTETSNK